LNKVINSEERYEESVSRRALLLCTMPTAHPLSGPCLGSQLYPISLFLLSSWAKRRTHALRLRGRAALQGRVRSAYSAGL